MTVFIQGAALALVGVVLCVVLKERSSHTALLLGIAVCCMLLAAAVELLSPVVELFSKLQELCLVDEQIVSTVVKIVAVGLLGEFAALICADGGSAAMDKAVRFLTSAAALWLAVPLMNALLELIQRITGEL